MRACESWMCESVGRCAGVREAKSVEKKGSFYAGPTRRLLFAGDVGEDVVPFVPGRIGRHWVETCGLLKIW